IVVTDASLTYRVYKDFKDHSTTKRGRRIQRECELCSVLQDAFLVVVAILFFVLCIYAFFYLNLSTELNLDVDSD
uniref:Triple QxxK/R motif-containing protein n=1 Tax=Takifugu rubripes TaxID=31033 RepID=A0A674NLB8_TAKRU